MCLKKSIERFFDRNDKFKNYTWRFKSTFVRLKRMKEEV